VEHQVSAAGQVTARIFTIPGIERVFARPIDTSTIEAQAPALPLLLETLALLHRHLVAPIRCSLELFWQTADGRSDRLVDRVIQAPPPAFMPRPASDWTHITEVADLSPRALEIWIRRALAERGPDGAPVWFDGVYSAETRVRLPDALGADEVELTGTGIRVPVERREDGSRWVAGRTGRTIEAPVLLSFRIGDDSITLSLGFCWSLWTDRGSPGRALVDEVAARVAALGWDDRGFVGE
jgi:hypothetical protein